MNPMTTYLLHLSGPALTIVWTLMAGLVAAGVAGFYNWRNKRAMARAQGGGEGAGAGVEKEIEVFIRDAETRLAQSALGKEAKLAQLPVFFLIGENASAKTSIFVHSGVEPDLLAG